MKIAHVADSVEVGGAEVMMATLARIHRAEGHEVSVHCLYAEGPLAKELRDEGIAVLVHGPAPGGVLLRRLWRAFRDNRPDVVHCHNAAATVYGAPVAKFAGVRTVVATRHGLADRQLFRQELKFWIAARLFCRTIVVVSEAVRRSLESHALACPGKLALIRNGAAALDGGGGETRGGGFVLVNVARLTPLKDHLTLLRAVELARKTIPDLKLWIIGDGEQRAKLNAYISQAGMGDWVSLLGERKDVGAYLARADVFVLSSRSEGLPISLLEAMASGLPAVSTEVGGIPEVAALSGACELAPPSNPQALADAICRVASRRDQLKEIGARARQCYQAWFSPERMAKEYMRLYQQRRPASSASVAGKLAAKGECQ